MKIGIYARGLSEKFGGVKEYIKATTQALIDHVSYDLEIFILHNCNRKQFSHSKQKVKEIIIPSKSKALCDFFLAPKIINQFNLDLVWFPKNVIPFFVQTKKVLTIHDLAYYFPRLKAYRPIDTFYMKLMIRNSCRRADKIITVSNNTKKDLIKILDVKEEKIRVIYEAADSKYRVIKNKQNLNQIKNKYQLKTPFILAIGKPSPRKNIVRTLKAFGIIKNSVPHNLVITGKILPLAEKIIKKLNTTRIRYIKIVPEDDLPYLYNLADFFIYPSLYEGFGLPILEAQSCGCPVICSNTSSLPEVAATSVLYINPYRTNDMVVKMKDLAQNKNLKKQLATKGFKNAKRFSLKKSAERLLKIFLTLL